MNEVEEKLRELEEKIMFIKNNKRNKSNNTTTSITGSSCFNSYRIHVLLNKEMRFENIEALGTDMKELDYEFVISMDIIQQGNLIIKNNKKTILKFTRIKNRGMYPYRYCLIILPLLYWYLAMRILPCIALK